ncbi:MAG: adenylate/guanylate cyclase domain-containing protein [Deltaproteobacteria bacterium]|nr:adenylate/guanylate cyclase domain-containing protein [Deltaproteobacteria bacterium]
MQPGIQFVQRNDGGTIAFVQFGQGPPLVCPAAWVTSLSYILEDRFASRFWESLSKGVTVVLYDKLGCGESDRERKAFTLEAELIDLRAVIAHLGLERFSMLGSSQEGPVAIAYTLENPEKVSRLILYGTYARGEDLASQDVKSALVNLIRASWGLGSRTLAEIFVPEADTEHLQSLGSFQRKSSTPETAAKLMEMAYRFDVSDKLSRIKTPTLILHREGDKVISVDQGRNLAREIPNARFKVLKGDMHPWWYGASNEIVYEILAFVGEGAEKGIDADLGGPKQATFIKQPTEDSSDAVSEIVEQATILFSDMVSSTELVTELGDSRAREIFLEHDKIIREQIDKHSGRELQNLGDGFMLTFETASNAIRCARDIQKHITQELPDIKVRIGLHTGEVVLREARHPFGRAVVMASRLLSQAQGGQILTSDITRQIVSGGAFEFRKMGSFTPKGFDESMDMYEIAWKQ